MKLISRLLKKGPGLPKEARAFLTNPQKTIFQQTVSQLNRKNFGVGLLPRRKWP